MCHPDELTLEGHSDLVQSVAFSPDGRRLASGSNDQTVKIWDTATGKELFALKGHGGSVVSVAFSPDGRRLASGSFDQTVRIWDTATGKELFVLKGHGGRQVIHVAFSTDGQRLASANADGSLYLWETTNVSAEIQRRRVANQLVADLFGQTPLRADVLKRLGAISGMSLAGREEAIAAAQTYPEDPSALKNFAWELIKLPGGEMSGYREALHYIEVVCHLDPENGELLNTLGIANYRVGQYEKALDILLRSDRVDALRDKGSHPTDLAFLCMAHQQLGHAKEAEVALQILRQRIKDSHWAQNPLAQGFLREVEELLARPSSPNSK